MFTKLVYETIFRSTKEFSMDNLLITNTTIITLDPDRPVLRNSCVGIRNGKIDSVGYSRGEYDRCIDGSHYIIMPGLVNAHTHSPMTLLRGLADDVTLDEWLHDYIWPAENALSREDYYYGALLGIAEMLATGTTSMTDMYRASGELIRAAIESGIKANICESITSDEAFDPNTHQGVLESVKSFEQFNGFDNGRIRIDTSIQSCWQTTPALWECIANFASDKDIGIHVHLAETQSELEHCRKNYGDSPVRLLEKAGVFQNRVIAVHGIWLDEEDQHILKDSGACIVHDPASNLKCCCGFANLKPYVEKGIPMALATDGVCSNNSADLFDTMKSTALIQKMLSNDPCLLPAEDVLRMAVQGGLYSQGREKEAGMIKEGLDADLIAIDANFPSMLPGLSPVSDMVYSASGAMVKLTMVRGKILYENGVFTTIDMEQLKAKIAEITSRY